MSGELIFAIFLTLLAFIILAKTAVIVPQQTAFVVERLGNTPGHSTRDFIF